jgi:apolipoprotein N-acyltransferase
MAGIEVNKTAKGSTLPQGAIALLGASLAGGVLTLSFAPFYIWPLGIASLVLLYGWVVTAPSMKYASFVGGMYGLGAFATGASWVYVALPKLNGLYSLPSIVSTSIFIMYLAFYIATTCGVARLLIRNSTSDSMSSAVFASLWVLGEWLRGNLFGGFTSQEVGYMQIDGPLSGWAPVIGTYGVSWLTVFVGGLVFHALCKSKARIPKLAVVFGIIITGMGLSLIAWTQPYGRPLSIRLLQLNVEPSMRPTMEKVASTLDQYYVAITAKRADLIITPETALPSYWHALPPDYINGLSRFAQNSKSNVLLGIPSIENNKITNNVVGILADRSGIFPRYEKFHLMPFGEYIPPEFHWFVQANDSFKRYLTSGKWAQDVMRVKDQRLGFFICQEGMFGEEVIRWVPDATILINPSNLGWFGNSLAIAQMLQIARMRALETGRPVLSTPNSGMTAEIDSSGKVISTLPPFVPAVLEGKVQGMAGRTPYSIWGNYPILIIILMILIAQCSVSIIDAIRYNSRPV